MICRRLLSVPLVGALVVLSAQAEQPLVQRITQRDFPSVFQAWSAADNLNEPPHVTMARHDLIWNAPQGFGLEWDQHPGGLAEGFTASSIERARRFRQTLLRLNPNLVLIAEIRYRDANRRYLPPSHPWWLREQGKIATGWEEGRCWRLDFHNPAFQRHVAKQARAAVATGVVDGVMLDWWRDDDSRLAMIEQVRQAIGDQALIIANANDVQTPRTASYINGYFMECYRSQTPQDWQRISETLRWAEQHLRQPRVTCLETWYHDSRQDLHLMRATTTLVLTQSDGYCLFSDPNPLPTRDHRHNWYPFWDQPLGKPKAKGQPQPDGSWRRAFEHGIAVYNPMGNGPVTAIFERPMRSAATGRIALQHQIAASDGDILLDTE